MCIDGNCWIEINIFYISYTDIYNMLYSNEIHMKIKESIFKNLGGLNFLSFIYGWTYLGSIVPFSFLYLGYYCLQ